MKGGKAKGGGGGGKGGGGGGGGRLEVELRLEEGEYAGHVVALAAQGGEPSLVRVPCWAVEE